MTYERTKQLLLDLIALRAQEDRLVTEAVLRKDWDDAARLALRSQRISDAIERMVLSGQPHPQETWMDLPAGDQAK